MSSKALTGDRYWEQSQLDNRLLLGMSRHGQAPGLSVSCYAKGAKLLQEHKKGLTGQSTLTSLKWSAPPSEMLQGLEVRVIKSWNAE